MFKFKSSEPYWTAFSSYQSFRTVDELNNAVKNFISVYDLTDAIKAVLNTIKLHSKRFFGVCWLRKEQIAKKAGVSPSTVDRAIKGLKETGFLKVVPFNHTKFGRRTHNIYILNPFEIEYDDVSQEVTNEVAQEDEKEIEKPVVPTVCDRPNKSYKNPHTNSNNSLNHLSNKGNELKYIPDEFIDILEPFYANNPEIIRDRWKTVCVAVKKSCISLSYTSFDTIRKAWDDTVKKLKRGRIKTCTDDGIGGYFYSVLCDYLMNDWLRTQKFHTPL